MFKKKTQKEHTFTVDRLIKAGGAYIRVGLYPE